MIGLVSPKVGERVLHPAPSRLLLTRCYPQVGTAVGKERGVALWTLVVSGDGPVLEDEEGRAGALALGRSLCEELERRGHKVSDARLVDPAALMVWQLREAEHDDDRGD